MPIPNYVEGFPQDGSSLGSTKVQIRNNLDGTFETLSVDHQNQNQTNPGYHKVIHAVAQTINTVSSWNPVVTSGIPGLIQATKISGIQQIFGMNYTPNFAGATADTQLFTMTGNGGISQLSGNQAAQEGWAWVCGILIQWGQVTGLGGSWPTTPQTVTFTSRSLCIPFPNACFVVNTTFIGPTSSSTGDITINSKSITDFTWEFSGSSSATFDGFYWFAIGS